MSNENTQAEAFDVFNVFKDQATSSELQQGVHERVRLITIDAERRKDHNGNVIKKQLFLKFKKFSKDNVDIGEKEISFFLIDTARDTALSNLHTFVSQTREMLSVFLTDEELEASFDPFSVLRDAEKEEGRDEKDIENDYSFDMIRKKALKKSSAFTQVEKEICRVFKQLLEDKAGFDSEPFRLKLEESKEGGYIQIPRFDRFVEKAEVTKQDSVLYANNK